MFFKINNISYIIKYVLRRPGIQRRLQSSASKSASTGPVMLSHNILEPRSKTETRGPPVLIMHGLMGSKQNWKSVSKKIHEGLNHSRQIVLLDNRNHGMSPRTEEHSQKLIVEDVYFMIKALGLNKPVLLGHSLGGSTMMFLALLHPELISGLVVVEMSPRSHTLPQMMMHKLLPILKTPSFEDVDGSLPKAKRKALVSLAQKIKDKPTINFIMQNLYKDSDGKIKWRLNLDTLGKSKVEPFPPRAFNLQYPGPCLFLGGHKSEFVKESDLPEIRKMFPRAEMQILDGGGHLLQVDRPQEFVSAITAFLNDSLRT